VGDGELFIYPGYVQAGAPAGGRVLVVARGRAGLGDVRLEVRSASGYSFVARRGPADDPAAIARALGEAGVRVHAFELPAPADDAPLEITAEARGTTASKFVRPLPARVGGGLSFVFGSCTYGYHEERAASLGHALEREHDAGASFSLFLGDNVYCDVHPTRVGPDPHAHVARIYAHAFAESAGLRRAMSAGPTMFAFDDHDFYDGYPETQPHVARTWIPFVRDQHVRAAREAIEILPAALDPAPVVSGSKSYRFDVDPISFFVLDLRTQRTRLDAAWPRLTGDDDLAQLEAWAAGLRAPGVLALEQPLYLEDGSFHEPSPTAFHRQFERILRALAEAPYDVLVLAGDLHWSQLVLLDVAGRRIPELTSSPFVRIPSFARNMLTRAIGTPEDQESQEVVIPKSITRPPVALPFDVARYVMGTSVANTFCRVRLRVPAAGRVDADVDFFDHAAGAVARSEADRGRGMQPEIAIGSPCRARISLGPRP
jgi:hypothetical protein